ncbi:MAG: DUF5343 domain-containing protein [Methanomassiliicoccales archaeon]|nr:DUF5343 domain-containing protein [Methanomassiliicoccales archaeon]
MVSGSLYTTVTGKLPTVFDKIATMGIPKTPVDSKWLALIGLTTSNDRTLLNVLKGLGFIGDDGIPTERWVNFRDATKRASVMEEAIKEAYSDLFEAYPEAHKQSDDDLINFFKNRQSSDGSMGGVAERTATTTLQTFKALGKMAGLIFSDNGAKKTPQAKQTPRRSASKATSSEFIVKEDAKPIEKLVELKVPSSPQVILNVNIQLAVPETTDEDVYDKFFAALKKHLMS